jgi:hypothetical protein
MIEISNARFEVLAAYTRHPATLAIGEEVRWFEAAAGRIVANVLRDRSDNDFFGIVLGRDERERFRWIAGTSNFDTPQKAVEALAVKIKELLPNLDEECKQGDVKGPPVDFFAPQRNAKQPLHPAFLALRDQEGYSPARGCIEPMMRWYEDADGNFVEQFQTTGFDARIWELYLFAAFTEAGFAINREVAVPDYTCWGLNGEFSAEATTINPSRDKAGVLVPPPPVDSEEQVASVLKDYLPIKYAGPLTTKLAKRYWEQKSAAGKPFLLAIQDFHAPMAMTFSRSALSTYLYGLTHAAEREADGSLRIVVTPIERHEWNGKVVQSGFFNLEGAENVSAVIFNASATLSKFNRIGLMAGFGSKRVRLTRKGIAIDIDPRTSEPIRFERDVNAPGYSEGWIEGMDVYHNPRAKHPLNPSMLPGAAHHQLLPDGQVLSTTPAWQPLASITSISVAGNVP